MTDPLPFVSELESLIKDPKASEDFSKQAQELIQNGQTLVNNGKELEAVESVLVLEKKARQAADAITCSKLVCFVLEALKHKKDWALINEYLVVLCKKRGQLKRAIIDMVQLCMTWLDDTPDMKEKLKLIDTLCSVTNGKIFVEVERAKVVFILAKIKEDEGNVDEAANLLQEVQVETFGAMEMREKAEYILEQLRIMLKKGDFVRCHIIHKKINPKLLDKEEFQDIKLRFHEYMMEYYIHEEDYLEVCKCYHKCLHTKVVEEDPQKWQNILQFYALFLVLAPFETEQKQLLSALDDTEAKRLAEIPIFQEFVRDFIKQELMAWPLSCESQVKSHAVFTDEKYIGGQKRWELLRKRVSQHNLEVLSLYYSHMRLSRAAELLSLTEAQTEAEISELVSAKLLEAKIDRPLGTVTFGCKKTSAERLNEWSQNISELLDLTEESCHLIAKERMVHEAYVCT